VDTACHRYEMPRYIMKVWASVRVGTHLDVA